jgi:hypothetical protein
MDEKSLRFFNRELFFDIFTSIKSLDNFFGLYEAISMAFLLLQEQATNPMPYVLELYDEVFAPI